MATPPRASEVVSRLADLARLSLPVAASTLVIAVGEIADRAFLGRWSANALAATLPGGMLARVFTGVLVGTVGYSAARISRFTGVPATASLASDANEAENLSRARGASDATDAATTAFAQGLWLTLFATPVFLVAAPVGLALIDAAGHAEAIRAHEQTYYLFNLAGGALATLAAALGAWFVGCGQTGRVATAALVGCGVNLLADPLLIFGLGWGVAGAGAAAVLAQTTTCGVLATLLCRDFRAHGRTAAGCLRFRRAEATRLLRMGLPVGLSSLVGSTTFTAFVLALGRLDAAALTVGNACFAVNNFFCTLLAAVETAIMIRTGRAVGESNTDEARRICRTGFALDALLFAVFFGLVLMFPEFALNSFVKDDDTTTRAAFAAQGRVFLAILAVAGVFRATQSALTGFLRGTGDTRRIFVAQVIASLLVWMPLVAGTLAGGLPPAVLFATFPLQLAVNAAILAAPYSFTMPKAS